MTNTLILKEDSVVTVTDKEIEIVEGLKNDLTISQIANNSGISSRTMEGRVIKLKGKVNAKTLPGLLSLFISHGLVSAKTPELIALALPDAQ